MRDPASNLCTRCGLAEATCYAVLSPDLARAFHASATQFAEQGLCDRCWSELFGEARNHGEWVQHRVRLSEPEMERASDD
jgi:hypothetical protein